MPGLDRHETTFPRSAIKEGHGRTDPGSVSAVVVDVQAGIVSIRVTALFKSPRNQTSPGSCVRYLCHCKPCSIAAIGSGGARNSMGQAAATRVRGVCGPWR